MRLLQSHRLPLVPKLSHKCLFRDCHEQRSNEGKGGDVVGRVRRPPLPGLSPSDWSPFPVGEPNTAYAKYFIGRSYLAPASNEQVHVNAVTFEPGVVIIGMFITQITEVDKCRLSRRARGHAWGGPARRLHKGDTVNIPAGVKHWHGASSDSWFQHLGFEVLGVSLRNEWFEPVDDNAYREATV